ncbi:biotin/lipoyl-binding protein [bacterium]|nr:biotin/lipoyl-binding protein [bacterium]
MKNNFTVLINGQEKTVSAEIIDKKIWFKLDEQTYSYDLIDLVEGSRKSKAATKSPDKILAPMPGKVTKVFVSEKQIVNKGDALLVMEAMKMEYTLKADISASVEKLFAKVGDQVTLGYLLIQLKENK